MEFFAHKKDGSPAFAEDDEEKSSSNVPRGTFSKLEKFVELLLKWNEKINLIGRRSSSSVWQKHVIPSAQLIEYIQTSNPTILDVGSGAGFPGIVISIITGWRVVLVERNTKKCIFLKEAQKVTGANIIVENQTIEATKNFPVDIIVSRGVTSIPNFLALVDKFLNDKVMVMLMKGDRCQAEIDASFAAGWRFDYDIKHEATKKNVIARHVVPWQSHSEAGDCHRPKAIADTSCVTTNVPRGTFLQTPSAQKTATATSGLAVTSNGSTVAILSNIRRPA